MDLENRVKRSRWLRQGALWVGLLAVSATWSCAVRPGGPERVAGALAQAAEVFRTAAPARRCGVGERVAALLPHCPALRQVDLGNGHITVLDYDHPSFILTERQVVRLLGKPAAVIDGNLIYLICRESKYSGYLEVEIHAGLVASALLTGGF